VYFCCSLFLRPRVQTFFLPPRFFPDPSQNNRNKRWFLGLKCCHFTLHILPLHFFFLDLTSGALFSFSPQAIPLIFRSTLRRLFFPFLLILPSPNHPMSVRLVPCFAVVRFEYIYNEETRGGAVSSNPCGDFGFRRSFFGGNPRLVVSSVCFCFFFFRYV